MKYLENPDLLDLCVSLNRSQGIYKLDGRIEAFDFSTEETKEKAVIEVNPIVPLVGRRRSNSLLSYSSTRRPLRKRSSSLGDLNEPSSQQLLLNLVATLNEVFPDYDFENTKATQFKSLELSSVRKTISSYFSEISGQRSEFLFKLWNTIDMIVDLYRCEIFSFTPPNDDDSPLNENSLWSLNYFFFNKDTMRICYFTCSSVSNLKLGSIEEDEEEEEDFGDGYDSLEDEQPKRKHSKCYQSDEEEDELDADSQCDDDEDDTDADATGRYE